MKRFALAVLASLLSSGMVVADEHDRYEHFEGKPSETLAEAVTNFSEGNQRLAELIAADSISDEQMNEIHMLSYTIENALQKIDEEVDAMAILLEEVHLGSETLDQARVLTNGQEYLSAAQTLVE
ncbi:DUF6746 family protein [Vreelandella nigrificans]|uniref:Uncharacterized protein n=1 Tax=Vreelandella nigrificans TaxID=2042704 RepID=A0A2A4HMS9_9GAMM|nr:DUF6746 family protein [Halomonas nigrificans]PCF95505.1 hypothetical protein CPA45_12145 [Halomonas nigrificans]